MANVWQHCLLPSSGLPWNPPQPGARGPGQSAQLCLLCPQGTKATGHMRLSSPRESCLPSSPHGGRLQGGRAPPSRPPPNPDSWLATQGRPVSLGLGVKVARRLFPARQHGLCQLCVLLPLAHPLGVQGGGCLGKDGPAWGTRAGVGHGFKSCLLHLCLKTRPVSFTFLMPVSSKDFWEENHTLHSKT